MADFRIALGGTISACTTDELHDGLNALEGKLLKGVNKRPQPIYRPLGAYINIGSMNQFDAKILELGSPAAGRMWMVPRITVLGNGDTATLTGVSAALYIGNPLNATLTQCVQQGSQIPFTTIENASAFPVHSRETLFLNIVCTAGGGATGVVVTANGVALEFPDSIVDAQGM